MGSPSNILLNCNHQLYNIVPPIPNAAKTVSNLNNPQNLSLLPTKPKIDLPSFELGLSLAAAFPIVLDTLPKSVFGSTVLGLEVLVDDPVAGFVDDPVAGFLTAVDHGPNF